MMADIYIEGEYVVEDDISIKNPTEFLLNFEELPSLIINTKLSNTVDRRRRKALRIIYEKDHSKQLRIIYEKDHSKQLRKAAKAQQKIDRRCKNPNIICKNAAYYCPPPCETWHFYCGECEDAGMINRSDACDCGRFPF